MLVRVNGRRIPVARAGKVLVALGAGAVTLAAAVVAIARDDDDCLPPRPLGR